MCGATGSSERLDDLYTRSAKQDVEDTERDTSFTSPGASGWSDE